MKLRLIRCLPKVSADVSILWRAQTTMILNYKTTWRCAAGLALAMAVVTCAMAADQVRTESGIVEGTTSTDSKIHIYKGIPFAAPPIGPLRWQPPQPAPSWQGVRKVIGFGSRCMQGRIYQDMVFRDPGPSEDCLYLNVWTPTASAGAHLPVMVWIFGGGFQAGSPSEPRQDGENLARKGVVVVSMNYRLGVFGFFSHPELAKESPHHSAGNYGLLDQVAALNWVHKNIQAFGGDPGNVTIFGESAGSISVSAQMASPLSKGLFKRAIGESGGVFLLGNRPVSLDQTEQAGRKFAESLGAKTLQALRAKPAGEILQAALKDKSARFWPNVDGYFYDKNPVAIYAAGDQAHVPLLAGWNADEQSYHGFLGKAEPTKENYAAKVREYYGENAGEILKLFPGNTGDQVKESARDLASARFIAYSTWKWLDMHLETGKSPVYRYHFEQAPPMAAGEASRGAYHSADIEYVFETLDSKHLPWTADDRKLSGIISSYWTNFARTGNPNGPGLPEWPAYSKNTTYGVMHLHVSSAESSLPKAAPDTQRSRYQLLDRIAQEKTASRKP
jgi:para-nitrobenzyl esterase